MKNLYSDRLTAKQFSAKFDFVPGIVRFVSSTVFIYIIADL